jgi:hypothetical protein
MSLPNTPERERDSFEATLFASAKSDHMSSSSKKGLMTSLGLAVGASVGSAGVASSNVGASSLGKGAATALKVKALFAAKVLAVGVACTTVVAGGAKLVLTERAPSNGVERPTGMPVYSTPNSAPKAEVQTPESTNRLEEAPKLGLEVAPAKTTPAIAAPTDGPRAVAAKTSAPVRSEPVADVPGVSDVQRPTNGAKTPVLEASATPAALASAKQPSALEEEIALIHAARAALSKGRSANGEAKAALDAHAKRFPTGLLSEEAEVLRIDLLVGMGDTKSAKSKAMAFMATHPSSAHSGRLRSLLATLEASP